MFHEYRICNECECNPIWGVLFNCETCNDYDLCETCYDNELQRPDAHPRRHSFRFL